MWGVPYCKKAGGKFLWKFKSMSVHYSHYYSEWKVKIIIILWYYKNKHKAIKLRYNEESLFFFFKSSEIESSVSHIVLWVDNHLSLYIQENKSSIKNIHTWWTQQLKTKILHRKRILETLFWEPCFRPGLTISGSWGDGMSSKPFLQNSNADTKQASECKQDIQDLIVTPK